MRALPLLGLIAALGLSACAGDDKPDPQIVNVPTPVSCVPADFPARPANPAAKERLLAAQDEAERYQLLAQFWSVMTPRLDLLEATVLACARVAPPPR